MTTDARIKMIAAALNQLLPKGTVVHINFVQVIHYDDGHEENQYMITIDPFMIDNRPVPALAIQADFMADCTYDEIYNAMQTTIGTITAQHLGIGVSASGFIVGIAPPFQLCSYRFVMMPPDGQAWFNEYLPGVQLVGMYLCDDMLHTNRAEATFRDLISLAIGSRVDPRIISESEFLHEQAEAAVKGTRKNVQ